MKRVIDATTTTDDPDEGPQPFGWSMPPEREADMLRLVDAKLLRAEDPLCAPDTARASAFKRSCLKPPEARNAAYNPYINKAGDPITKEDSEALVLNKLRSGAWRLVEGGVKRDAFDHRYQGRPPQCLVMEFVCDGRERTWTHTQEIKLAGYDHWAERTSAGWHAADMEESGAKGWGRVLADVARLELYHERRQFNRPLRHYSGDGWVFRAQHYGLRRYPDADAHGPRGPMGPRWGSSWCGD